MRKSGWQSAATAVAIGLAALTSAHADVVTFDDILPSGFGGGETFVSGGFSFTLTSGLLQAALGFPEQGGFGIVDTAASLSLFSNAPTGNSTQFYAGLNDNAITLTGSTPVISVTGFDFGFVPPVTAPGATSGFLLAAAWLDEAGAFGVNFYDFGVADRNGDWAFITANTATPDFGVAMPTFVREVTFLACNFQGQCLWPSNNQGQFALDNIRADLPLPGTWLLAGLGLAGLAITRRRQAGAVAR